MLTQTARQGFNKAINDPSVKRKMSSFTDNANVSKSDILQSKPVKHAAEFTAKIVNNYNRYKDTTGDIAASQLPEKYAHFRTHVREGAKFGVDYVTPPVSGSTIYNTYNAAVDLPTNTKAYIENPDNVEIFKNQMARASNYRGRDYLLPFTPSHVLQPARRENPFIPKTEHVSVVVKPPNIDNMTTRGDSYHKMLYDYQGGLTKVKKRVGRKTRKSRKSKKSRTPKKSRKNKKTKRH